MLYATQLRLGLKDLASHKITDAYSIHRLVYSLFEDYRSEKEKNSSNRSGFVFTEIKQRDLFREFLIISDRKPQEDIFTNSTLVTKIIPESFLQAERYHFSVVINPTKRDRSNGNLVAIRGRDTIAEWFKSKSEKNWGFQVNKIIVEETKVLKFRGKANREILISQALLSGSLTVTDRAAFIKAFSHGIGRGHAFGCGLLQIIPIFN